MNIMTIEAVYVFTFQLPIFRKPNMAAVRTYEMGILEPLNTKTL